MSGARPNHPGLSSPAAKKTKTYRGTRGGVNRRQPAADDQNPDEASAIRTPAEEAPGTESFSSNAPPTQVPLADEKKTKATRGKRGGVKHREPEPRQDSWEARNPASPYKTSYQVARVLALPLEPLDEEVRAAKEAGLLDEGANMKDDEIFGINRDQDASSERKPNQ